MLLSSFGLISLNGSVVKLEPNLDFERYQTAMSYYGKTLSLKARVENQQKKHGAADVLGPAMPAAKKL